MLPFLLALCSLALGDESICVSNKGHPYDKAHCEEVAQKYGCVFKDNQCVCANGGYYAKTSHHCYPPSPTTTASTTTSTTTTTTTPVASSMCVSNRGRPYDESDCGWIAKDYGCTWSNGHCYCKNGGTFAKTSKFCWPPDTPTNQPKKKSRDWWHVLDLLVTWFPGPEWVSWILDLVLCASCCARPAWRALQHRRPMRSLTDASQPLHIADEDHVEVVAQHRSP